MTLAQMQAQCPSIWGENDGGRNTLTSARGPAENPCVKESTKSRSSSGKEVFEISCKEEAHVEISNEKSHQGQSLELEGTNSNGPDSSKIFPGGKDKPANGREKKRVRRSDVASPRGVGGWEESLRQRPRRVNLFQVENKTKTPKKSPVKVASMSPVKGTTKSPVKERLSSKQQTYLEVSVLS